MVKKIIFILSVFTSCVAGAQLPSWSWFSSSDDAAKLYSFVCVSSGRLTSDTCDICPSTIVESRSFNGLLIKRDSMPWRWIDQPYSIRVKPGNIIEYWEHGANPYSERLTIPLSQTPFTTVQAMADSTWCNATSPGSYALWYASDSTNTAPVFRSDTVTIIGHGIVDVTFDSLLQKFVITADTTGLGGGGGSSLWTDAGAFAYLTATTDRVVVGSATEIDTDFEFQSNGGILSKGTGTDATTFSLKATDSGNTATFATDDLGQSGFGKSVTLLSGTNYAAIGTLAATPGGGGSLTLTNGSGGSITSTAGFIGGNVIFAGSDAFTEGRGLSFNTLNNNTSTSNVIRGIYASARGNTAGSRASAYTGVMADAYTEQTAGTVTNTIAYNARFWGVNAAGSTTTNVYGAKLDNILNSGTITNTFGYWVGDITTGTQTNTPYSFISTDANARQGFSGSTQLGGTGVPSRTLHVVGEARITDLTTDAPIKLIGADADGDLNDVQLGVGLALNAGTLDATGVSVVLDDGAIMPTESTLNFISTATVDMALTDDPGNLETEIRATVPNDAITYAKLQNAVGNNVFLLNNNGAGTDYEEGTVANAWTMLGITGVANRFALFTTATAIGTDAAFTFDGANDRMTVTGTVAGTGANNAFLNLNSGAITGATEFLRMSGNINGNMIAGMYNANNTGGANSLFQISVGGASAADPVTQYTVSGVVTHSIGIDNSDVDKLKIKTNAATPSDNANRGITITNAATALVGVNMDAPLHPLDVNGVARSIQFRNTGNQYVTGDVAFGTGAGTGPTVNSISGGGNWLQITFTTGTAPTANANILTLTYPNAFGTLTYPVLFARGDGPGQNFANEQVKFIVSSGVAASFTLKANGTLTASTQYGFSVNVGGY